VRRALGAAEPRGRDSLRRGTPGVGEAEQPAARCGTAEVMGAASGASLREKTGGRCHVYVYKPIQNVC